MSRCRRKNYWRPPEENSEAEVKQFPLADDEAEGDEEGEDDESRASA